jgi:hypothetical protein
LIRKLLGANDVTETDVAEDSPTRINTPESYLGYERLARYEGDDVKENRLATYSFPKRQLSLDALAYDGKWRVERERIVAGENAKLRLRFQANDVFLVLGGKGDVRVMIDGLPARTVSVDGYRLYTLLDSPERTNDGLLELGFSPGVQAYAFTFGG